MTGRTEVDDTDDFWADHDYEHFEPHMVMDEMVEDEDYADGYKWNSCDRRPSERGCTTSHHVPRLSQFTPAKKQRTVGFGVVDR